jgi:hypothetical protein
LGFLVPTDPNAIESIEHISSACEIEYTKFRSSNIGINYWKMEWTLQVATYAKKEPIFQFSTLN